MSSYHKLQNMASLWLCDSFPRLVKRNNLIVNRPFPIELPFASVSKRVFVRKHSNKNGFDLHENGRDGGTHFHMNGFARRLVLKQRQRVTWKWPINGRSF